MKKMAWLAFWVLGLVWGSSFLLIHISVKEINPIELVFIRAGIAAVGLLTVVFIRRMRIPANPREMFPLLLIGLGNPAIPFLLINWGETIIESSVAGVLQSTASLFTMIVAHFVFVDERMNSRRVSGMVIGFIGVVVLFGLNVQDGQILFRGVLGQLAIVGASVFYAFAGVYTRVILNEQQFEPIVVAAFSMLSATVIMGIAMFAAPLLGGPSPIWLGAVSPSAMWSAIVLGVFNTFFAYILFYSIIRALGASRASMVTYIVPVVSVILGVSFGNDDVTINLFVGAALILSGIGIVNLKTNLRLFNRKSKVATEATS